MTAKKRVKVAITGAAGQIGYALCFRIASGQMFGPDTEVELQLLELKQALPALNGVAMELDDCAFPLLRNIRITSELKEAFDGVHWALLVGSVPRKDGMERSDLLKVNGGIFGPQGQALNEVADKNVKVVVVGNPCNTNCLIAMKNAPSIPKENFYAMTMLDENRAKTQLAQKAQVPVTDVTRMAIWGNHSATQYPNFHLAEIGGKKATEVITDKEWLDETFISTVQKRGAAIIQARGASSAASAANAIVDTVVSLTTETPASDWYSVARVTDGSYGITEELIFSFPCQTQKGTTQIVQGLELDDFSKKKIEVTHEELLKEKEAIKDLLG